MTMNFLPSFRSLLLGATVSMMALPLQAETWRVSTQASDTSTEGLAIQRFAELVEDYTEGEITVQVYPNEQLGKLDTVLDQLGQGVIQVVATSVAFLGKQVPALDFTTAPFLFEDYDQWARFMDSDLVQGWVTEAEDKARVHVLGDLAAFPRGTYRVLASAVPVESVDDIDGLLVRQWSQQILVDAWTFLGAEVRILAWSEVYDAINRQLVQAVTSPLELVEAQKFYEVAPYLVRTNEYPQALAFLVNKRAFEGLSPEMKAAVERAHADAASYMREMLAANAESQRAQLIEEGAIFSEIDIADLIARMDVFYKDLDARGELPDGLLEAVAAARAE